MNRTTTQTLMALTALLTLGVTALLLPEQAAAHCDSLDGPVVTDARMALDQDDIIPVLKWVRAADEPTLREAFAKTQAVRKINSEAKSLADSYFFETLVRIHRAGEGAPYTGLKPAGAIEPVIMKADQSLGKGSAEELAKAIASHTEAGIKERFQHAFEAKKHAQESVAAGREYVEAYVSYVHYVEGIVRAVHAEAHHGEPSASPGHQH